MVNKKSNERKYKNEEIVRIFEGGFLIPGYKHAYLHDEMLLPMVQFFVIQSPVLKANVLADQSLLGGPFVLVSLVKVQMILPILIQKKKKMINTVHLCLEFFKGYLPKSSQT